MKKVFLEHIKKEGRVYIILLALLLVAAFVLRVMNLTGLEPYSDEGSHLISALEINDHGKPTVVLNGMETTGYFRVYALSYLLAFLFALFGKSLFIARLPGVIISTLTIVPFYFLGRKINKPIGLTMAALWAFSPWAIAIAKNIREYAFFPFLFLLTGLFFIFAAERLIHMVEKKDFRITTARIASFFVFFLPAIYAQVDRMSTFRQVWFLYLTFFVVLFYGLLRSKDIVWKIKKKTLALFAVGFLISLILFLKADLRHLNKMPKFERLWFELFFGKLGTTPFYNANAYGFYVLFTIGILFSIYQFIKNKSLSLNFMLVAFLSYFYFYLFHFSANPPRPRHGFVILIWLLPIVAVGIYLIYERLLRKRKKATKVIISVALSAFLLTVFYPKNILRAVNQASYLDQYGTTTVTYEFHPQFLPVLEQFGGQIKSDDAIICSQCSPIYWHEVVPLMKNQLYYYLYTHEKRFEHANQVFEKNPEGWMILDVRRNGWWSKGFPKANFDHKDKTIQYFGKYGDFDVYRWGVE